MLQGLLVVPKRSDSTATEPAGVAEEVRQHCYRACCCTVSARALYRQHVEPFDHHHQHL